MGSRTITLVLFAALAAVAVLPIRAATTPAIRAKQAQAARVMGQIDAIDERLSVVTEQYNGARVRLDTLRGRLKTERRSLARARVRYRIAEDRLAKLLVSLYDSGRPSPIEAIFGVQRVSDMIAVLDAQAVIGHQDDAIAETALRARTQLQQRVRALAADRAAAAAAVAELAHARSQIDRGLETRRALLATVRAQISRLEAQERARQERLAALARARLAAEARARAQAQALAAAQARAASEQALAAAEARAKAEAAAARKQAASTPTAPPPPSAPAPPAAPSPAAVAKATRDPAAAPEAPAPAPAAVPPAQPSLPLPAPDAEAARIALQYIGVPYVWSGASPAGFDCSGLVSYVFAQIGISLPHYAAAQWTFGAPVPQDELQPGDLVFFDNLNHVGIFIGGDQFVDAPRTGSFVGIESLSDPWYASRYVGARRI